MLNAFLKACDDLTDILPEQEQAGLQEAVRKLHKQWKVSGDRVGTWCHHRWREEQEGVKGRPDEQFRNSGNYFSYSKKMN